MPSKRHFLALDGLRGIAAIAVAALHLFETIPVASSPPHAQLAVDFFFMLSGFVVAYAYEEKLLTTMSFRRFSLIRLIRLYPMVFFGVTIGVVSRLLDGAAGHGVSAVLGAAVFAYLLLPTPRNSATVSAFPLNGPLWSLTYELISNLVYGAAIHWLSTRVLVVLAVVSSISLGVVLVTQDSLQASVTWGPGLLYGFPRVFASFTIGVLLFRLGGVVHARSSVLGLLAAIALAAVLWAPIRESAIFDLAAILLVFPAILLGASRSSDQGRLSPIWKLLGALSYPVYAINQPFFRICAVVAARAGLPDRLLPWFAAASFFACLVAGLAILKLYDEPMRRFLSSRLRKSETVLAAPVPQSP